MMRRSDVPPRSRALESDGARRWSAARALEVVGEHERHGRRVVEAGHVAGVEGDLAVRLEAREGRAAELARHPADGLLEAVGEDQVAADAVEDERAGDLPSADALASEPRG